MSDYKIDLLSCALHGLNKRFIQFRLYSFIFLFYFTLNMLFTVKFNVPERIILCIWKAIGATMDPKLASLGITA